MTTNIETLPMELFQAIVARLGQRDHYSTALVCRAWKDPALDALWRTADVLIEDLMEVLAPVTFSVAVSSTLSTLIGEELSTSLLLGTRLWRPRRSNEPPVSRTFHPPRSESDFPCPSPPPSVGCSVYDHSISPGTQRQLGPMSQRQTSPNRLARLGWLGWKGHRNAGGPQRDHR